MEARACLDLEECMQKARDIDNKSCFHKLDLEAFEFLATIYGTEPQIVSAPDDSNISFFAGRNVLKVYDGPALFSKFLLHTHIIIISGASKSPMCSFYMNDVLPEEVLQEELLEALKKASNWLITTEINFEGILRKSKTSQGLLRILADGIDIVLNEIGEKDPAKLVPAHLIHVCDCSMPELGKELGGRDSVVSAPKVVVTVGDQPGEVPKYTPYTVKGESYRLDPICGDIEDALKQKRNDKKVERKHTAEYLAGRYACLAKQTADWASVELSPGCRGVGNVIEESIKEAIGDKKNRRDPMFSYLLGKHDSKWMNQACLSSFARKLYSPCCESKFCFVKDGVAARWPYRLPTNESSQLVCARANQYDPLCERAPVTPRKRYAVGSAADGGDGETNEHKQLRGCEFKCCGECDEGDPNY